MTKEQKEMYLILTGKWTNPKKMNQGKYWYYKGGSWITLDRAYEMEISGVYYDGEPFFNSSESNWLLP